MQNICLSQNLHDMAYIAEWGNMNRLGYMQDYPHAVVGFGQKSKLPVQ